MGRELTTKYQPPGDSVLSHWTPGTFNLPAVSYSALPVSLLSDSLRPSSIIVFPSPLPFLSDKSTVKTVFAENIHWSYTRFLSRTPSLVTTYLLISNLILKVVHPRKLDFRQKQKIFLSIIIILLLKGHFEREKIILHKKSLKHRKIILFLTQFFLLSLLTGF